MMKKIDSAGKEKKKTVINLCTSGHHEKWVPPIFLLYRTTLTPRCTAHKCANTSPCKHKSWPSYDETISKSLIWIAIQI